jgi:hypothetical protein
LENAGEWNRNRIKKIARLTVHRFISTLPGKGVIESDLLLYPISYFCQDGLTGSGYFSAGIVEMHFENYE